MIEEAQAQINKEMKAQGANKENMEVQQDVSKTTSENKQQENKKGTQPEPSLTDKTKKRRKGRKKAKLVTINETKQEGPKQSNQPKEIERPNDILEENTEEWVQSVWE